MEGMAVSMGTHPQSIAGCSGRVIPCTADGTKKRCSEIGTLMTKREAMSPWAQKGRGTVAGAPDNGKGAWDH